MALEEQSRENLHLPDVKKGFKKKNKKCFALKPKLRKDVKAGSMTAKTRFNTHKEWTK